jgi:cytochrome c
MMQMMAFRFSVFPARQRSASTFYRDAHDGRGRESPLGPILLIAAGLLIAPMHSACAQPPASDPTLHGKRLFLMCAACHTLHAGEADKVGPNLYGVVGKAAGSRGAFAYSESLKNSGIIWSAETLDAWLKQPSALVPGCKMAFPGLPNDQDRRDVIAYLTEATQ